MTSLPRDRVLSVALVGAGTMGAMYAQAMTQNPHARLVAICDRHPARAEALARAFGVDAFYGEQAAMLGAHQVDAVVVATPDDAHREPVLLALEHGAHVLCEKPLALEPADCDAMAEAVERSGRQLMVNYGNRHRPEIRILREELASGAIGPVGYVYLRLNERIEKPRGLSWVRNTNPTWFLHSHCVDLVTFLLQDSVAEVFGRQYLGKLQRELESPVPDTMVYLLRMAKGTVVTLESTWCLPQSFPSDVDIALHVVGENGTYATPLSRGVERYVEEASILRWDVGAERFDGARQGWWYDSCAYFIHCLMTGQQPHPTAREGAYVTRVLQAMMASVTQGQPVRPEA